MGDPAEKLPELDEWRPERVTPEVGAGRPDDGYRRESDRRRVPSVTTVLRDHEGPSGLMRWAAGLAIDAHAAGRPRWEAVKAHEERRDVAADVGTFVHEAIQAHIKDDQSELDLAIWDSPDPVHVEAALDRWREWEADRGANIVWHAIEVPLAHERLGGTPDMWGKQWLSSTTWRWILGDIKAGKRIYRKHGRQLGLYRWMLRELRGIDCAEAVILHVRPDAPVRHTQFGGEWLDAYEAAGLADLESYEANRRCPDLPGMWKPKQRNRRGK